MKLIFSPQLNYRMWNIWNIKRWISSMLGKCWREKIIVSLTFFYLKDVKKPIRLMCIFLIIAYPVCNFIIYFTIVRLRFFLFFCFLLFDETWPYSGVTRWRLTTVSCLGADQCRVGVFQTPLTNTLQLVSLKLHCSPEAIVCYQTGAYRNVGHCVVALLWHLVAVVVHTNGLRLFGLKIGCLTFNLRQMTCVLKNPSRATDLVRSLCGESNPVLSHTVSPCYL